MDITIQTARTILKQLTEVDVTEEYVYWLNKKKVNQYLESKFVCHTISSVREFVRKMGSDETNVLFGIFFDHKHIGNIKLGSIDSNHLKANIGLMIGDSGCWGQGIATEVIQAVTLFAFEEKGLKKIDAGCYESNLASKKVFIKSGFEVEGFLKSHVIHDGKREGVWLLGITPEQKEQGK